MVTAKVVTRARAEGLVILLVALGYVWEASRIPALFLSPGVPGPAAFPSVLGLVLGLAGLCRLLRGDPRAEAGRVKEADQAASAVGAAPSWLAGSGRFYLLWAVLLGFLTFLPELGFPVAACIGLVVMFRLLGERRWRVILPLSFAVTVVLYLLFSFGLGVRLPLGPLQHLLGR
jgi:hypothetical protein